jgi:hypothetical protein
MKRDRLAKTIDPATSGHAAATLNRTLGLKTRVS